MKKISVMGIVNINNDSFSGDGTLNIPKALQIAQKMVAQGATIIDIGAESARTNRKAISITQEVDRLASFIQAYDCPAPLSINTWRPQVVRQILPIGGHILNDIGALPTPENAELCAKHHTTLLVMHSVGLPKIAHTAHKYKDDIMAVLEHFFQAKLAICDAAGLPTQKVIIDPGIDFAKQRQDNLTIFRQLHKLQKFGRPILLPVSRKTVIGEVLKIENPTQRDPGTIACIAAGIQGGASIFRVHNVPAAIDAIRILKQCTKP